MKSIYFLTSKEDFFTFVFAPCASVVNPGSTQMTATPLFLRRFCCCLFQHVALSLLSFPLSLRSLPCTPSSSFLQRAAALLLSFPFADPPAHSSMFLWSIHSLKTLESLPCVLPCFSNFKLSVWTTSCGVALDYVLSICMFFALRFYRPTTCEFPRSPLLFCCLML